MINDTKKSFFYFFLGLSVGLLIFVVSTFDTQTYQTDDDPDYVFLEINTHIPDHKHILGSGKDTQIFYLPVKFIFIEFFALISLAFIKRYDLFKVSLIYYFYTRAPPRSYILLTL